jgi:hypothetical protein
MRAFLRRNHDPRPAFWACLGLGHIHKNLVDKQNKHKAPNNPMPSAAAGTINKNSAKGRDFSSTPERRNMHGSSSSQRFSGSDADESDPESTERSKRAHTPIDRRTKIMFLLGVTIVFGLFTYRFVQDSRKNWTGCESTPDSVSTVTDNVHKPAQHHESSGSAPTVSAMDVDPVENAGNSCSFKSTTEFTYAMQMIGVYCVLVVVVFLHDFFQSSRIHRIEGLARRATAIVSEIYPESVQKQLLSDKDMLPILGRQSNHSVSCDDASRSSETCGERGGLTNNQSIAELYTDVTLMFADIAGFTAWSSMREPTQVRTPCQVSLEGRYTVLAHTLPGL